MRRFVLGLAACSSLLFLVPKAIARTPAKVSDPVEMYVAKHAGWARARVYTPLIRKNAAHYHINPMLVARIIELESDFDPRCQTGPSAGLMQVNWGHALHHENLYDPATNIRMGCSILHNYYMRFGDWHAALSAYNMGPNLVAHRGIYRSRYSIRLLGY